MSCGADTTANVLLGTLTDDVDFTIPVIDISLPEFNIPLDRFDDLYGELKKLTNEDITTKSFEGTGTFDVIMAGFSAHLKKEYDANRITGAEYSKTFIALTSVAMQNAVQFLLQKDAAFWAAQQAQIQTITARLNHETAKALLAQQQFAAHAAKTGYATAKIKLASEDQAFCAAKFNLDYILPAQRDNLIEQKTLIKEQAEAQRAQTLDTRADGAPVVGSVGKQKELYSQQIVSYQRDSEVKAARLFTDAWITMKTIDEGLTAPVGFTNASVDQVLSALKNNNDLGI